MPASTLDCQIHWALDMLAVEGEAQLTDCQPPLYSCIPPVFWPMQVSPSYLSSSAHHFFYLISTCLTVCSTDSHEQGVPSLVKSRNTPWHGWSSGHCGVELVSWRTSSSILHWRLTLLVDSKQAKPVYRTSCDTQSPMKPKVLLFEDFSYTANDF